MSYSYVGEITAPISLTIEQQIRAISNALGISKDDTTYFVNSSITNTAWSKFKEKCKLSLNVDDSTLTRYLAAWLPEYADLKLPKYKSTAVVTTKPKTPITVKTDDTIIAPSGYTGGTGIDWMKYIKYGGIAGGIGLVGYFLYKKFSKRGI